MNQKIPEKLIFFYQECISISICLSILLLIYMYINNYIEFSQINTIFIYSFLFFLSITTLLKFIVTKIEQDKRIKADELNYFAKSIQNFDEKSKRLIEVFIVLKNKGILLNCNYDCDILSEEYIVKRIVYKNEINNEKIVFVKLKKDMYKKIKKIYAKLIYS